MRISIITRYYQLLVVGLGILFMLSNCTSFGDQEIRKRLEANYRVYVPNGEGPFPVVIAIPGCSGVSLQGLETDIGRPGNEGDRLFRRHYPRMAERLQKAGFLVLLVDYLTADDVLNTCNGEIHPNRVAKYIGEAVSIVKTIPATDSSRLHIMGWSHGGSGVLAWLANQNSKQASVRTATTIYPGCTQSDAWKSTLPVLMILAGADDIALPSVCNTLIQSLPDSTDVHVQIYEGARHGFDFTEGPTILSVGNGLTIGRNVKAGNKAWQEIFTFLKSH